MFSLSSQSQESVGGRANLWSPGVLKWEVFLRPCVGWRNILIFDSLGGVGLGRYWPDGVYRSLSGNHRHLLCLLPFFFVSSFFFSFHTFPTWRVHSVIENSVEESSRWVIEGERNRWKSMFPPTRETTVLVSPSSFPLTYNTSVACQTGSTYIKGEIVRRFTTLWILPEFISKSWPPVRRRGWLLTRWSLPYNEYLYLILEIHRTTPPFSIDQSI